MQRLYWGRALETDEQRLVVYAKDDKRAAKTLKITYDDLPRGDIGEIILADDASRDDTVRVASFAHQKVR